VEVHSPDGKVPTRALDGNYFHKPSPARMWNYLQGGKDNYPLDRIAGDAMADEHPSIFELAKQTRQFQTRAMRFVAEEGGVRQFLDIGCGLPAPPELDNVHDVAQRIHSDARVVYVDNDKVVLAHARALLTTSTPGAGTTAYVEADVQDVDTILSQAADTLDLSQPAAVSLLGVLGHVADLQEAYSIVTRLMAEVPIGSFLIQADGFDDGAELHHGVQKRNETGIDPYHLRTVAEMSGYFRGLEIVEPGIGSVTAWRPNLPLLRSAPRVLQYGAVAGKS